MDSDDDYQSLSPPKELSPQVNFRRLKRLKQSDSKPLKEPLFDSSDDPILFSHVDFAKLEALEKDSEPQFFEAVSTEDANLSQESLSQGVGDEDENGKIFNDSILTEEANLTQESPSQGVGNGVENGDKMELGIDVEVKRTRRVLEFDDDVVGESVIREGSENLDLGKKKEIIGEEDLLEEKEGKKKNKKKRREASGDELKTKSQGSNKRREERLQKNKRREEKEREEYLKQLHAESQRLLRETREASFKPVPVVQKPISSVLEKIRKRKLEISKKSMISNGNNHGVEQNIRPSDGLMDLDIPNKDISKENATITTEKEMIDPLEEQSCLATSNVDEHDAKLTIHENAQNQVPANEEPTPAPRAPVDDTQDLFDNSEPTGTGNVQNDEKPNSPLDEVFAPSLHAMNLKLDSVPVDYSSSEEEDYDKENFDPHPRGVADNSSPNGDPVKDFIDEEAEEEDDSDNDLNRFQENEDGDIDDLEELNAMIATEYEERLTDKEARNELHQKWLEQQDAAGTDNLIQRLKCGSVVRDTLLSDNELESDEDDGNDDEIDDETEEDSLPKESGRINIRKAKQIILKLYPDKEDTYLSDDNDDDDNMQRRRAQCLVRKEERATIASPAADASSREVFGLIKKLNISSDNKRKPKALSIFDSVLKGGSSGRSAKSSFVGRASNHHIPSSHKQGSAIVRPFIFGREDSNSRSSISISEDSLNSVAQEIRPTRNVTAKYSNLLTKVRTQTTDGAVEAMSSTSLLEILKRSSSKSKASHEETAVDLTKSIFAFRVPKKPKIEGRG